MALGNQRFTAPKISRSNISSSLSSGASRISGVAPKLNVSKVKFKSQGVSSSITGSQSSIENTLAETNQILVEIQNQLSLDFAMRIAEEKNKNKTLREEKSRRRFALKESAIESTKKIGNIVKSSTTSVLQPVKGIFEKIMDFLKTIGTGIAVNAVFTWLADKENREKLEGWFKFIQDHWKWGLVALGAVAALNIVGPISALVSVLGALTSVAIPLFTLLANPATGIALLTLAGVVAGTYAMVKASKLLIGIKQKRAYGDEYAEKGAFITNLGNNFGRSASSQDFNKMTPEEQRESRLIAGFDTMLQDRGTTIRQLASARSLTGFGPEYEKNKKERISSLENQLKYQSNMISQAENQITIKGRTLGDLFKAYQMTGAVPKSSIQARAMGGPVSAGTAYLVGERGPEIFSPNLNGSILSNQRTEKIYDMISSKGAGKINYITMDLPPIDARQPKSTTVPLAPEIPAVSPVNVSNPYMSVTPGIYGIYV